MQITVYEQLFKQRILSNKVKEALETKGFSLPADIQEIKL